MLLSKFPPPKSSANLRSLPTLFAIKEEVPKLTNAAKPTKIKTNSALKRIVFL